MSRGVRQSAADALVAVAVFVVAIWVLRGILGMFLWLASLIGLVLVVAALLVAAGLVRGRR